MKIIGFLILFLILGCGISGKLTQDGSIREYSYKSCMDLYQNGRWSETLDCLEGLPDSVRNQAYFDLQGTTFMQSGQPAQAIASFRRALDLDKEGQNPYLYFKWGESLWKNHQYREAGTAMRQYLENVNNPRPDIQAQTEYYLRSAAIADSLYRIPRKFNPELLSDSLNSEVDELGLSMTYDRRMLILTRRSDQEDLFESHIRDGVWGQAQPMNALNSPDNEGAVSLSGDGKFLVFTACNRPFNVGSCDLYMSEKSDTGWTEPELMPVINSDGWDSQPTLSPDGRAIIFSSERSGGFGGRDLWLSVIGQDGWIKPINLGPSINSPGNEENPFLHSDENTIYFTSDYWPGFGGRDLFMAQRIRGNEWTSNRNLGYPINSADHEEGIFIESSGQRGYFSSARGNRFDLYSFEIDPEIQPIPSLLYQMVVVNSITGEVIEGSSIDVYDWTREHLTRSISTDQDGFAAFLMNGNRKYGITASKRDFVLQSYSKTIGDNVNRDLIDTIRLDPIKETNTLILENVHFASGEALLLEGSGAELDQLASYLNENKNFTIRLTGHTDNVGSAEDNLVLSENRAEAVRNYLIHGGVNAARIKAEGQGETQPIVANDTPEGRQKNRRTEITIIR